VTRIVTRPPDGLVKYRAVRHNPPVEVDFHSYYESGRIAILKRPFGAYQVFGVSLFLDMARVQRFVDSAHRRGEDAWVAELALTTGAGLWGIHKASTTHLETFGLPRDLLNRVRTVS
jgi:hypothetical protein